MLVKAERAMTIRTHKYEEEQLPKDAILVITSRMVYICSGDDAAKEATLLYEWLSPCFKVVLQVVGRKENYEMVTT